MFPCPDIVNNYDDEMKTAEETNYKVSDGTADTDKDIKRATSTENSCSSSSSTSDNAPSLCTYASLSTEYDISLVVINENENSQEEKEVFKGHRKTLMHKSMYFSSMLGGSYSESMKDEVELRNISVSGFEYVIHYLHGCKPGCSVIDLIPADIKHASTLYDGVPYNKNSGIDNLTKSPKISKLVNRNDNERMNDKLECKAYSVNAIKISMMKESNFEKNVDSKNHCQDGSLSVLKEMSTTTSNINTIEDQSVLLPTPNIKSSKSRTDCDKQSDQNVRSKIVNNNGGYRPTDTLPPNFIQNQPSTSSSSPTPSSSLKPVKQTGNKASSSQITIDPTDDIFSDPFNDNSNNAASNSRFAESLEEHYWRNIDNVLDRCEDVISVADQFVLTDLVDYVVTVLSNQCLHPHTCEFIFGLACFYKFDDLAFDCVAHMVVSSIPRFEVCSFILKLAECGHKDKVQNVLESITSPPS